MARISSMPGKIASALKCFRLGALRLDKRHRSPGRAHSFARTNLTGPAPTIKTSVSLAAFGMTSFSL